MSLENAQKTQMAGVRKRKRIRYAQSVGYEVFQNRRIRPQDIANAVVPINLAAEEHGT
jgi:hypothetical protein